MAALADLTPDEVAQLRVLHAGLSHLRLVPWEKVAADPVILGCLRNVLHARNARQARHRAVLESQPFELVP